MHLANPLAFAQHWVGQCVVAHLQAEQQEKTVLKVNLKSDTETLRILEGHFQNIEEDKSTWQENIKFLQTLESESTQN